MDIDLFFAPGYDNMLSLEEMLEGDIKYSVELGLELKENSLSGTGDLATVADRSTLLDWGDPYHHSSLDIPGFDSTAGMMVNPKFVIPSLDKTTQIKEEIIDIKEEPITIKEEIKSEWENNEEDLDEGQMVNADVEEEEEEVDEDEEDDDDAAEEEQDEEESENDEPQPVNNGQSIWNRMLNRPANTFRPQRVEVSSDMILPSSRHSIKNHGISVLRVNNTKLLKSAELQINGGNLKRTHQSAFVNQNGQRVCNNFIKFRTVDHATKQQLQMQHHQHQQQHHQYQRIIKSPQVSTDGIKKTILLNNGSPRTIHTIKAKTPVTNTSNANNPRSVVGRFLSVEIYPKPAYSYSCLIAMALKNSVTGSLPVSEIYNFMCEHFPYFKSAPSGWKNSVRHNLSLNKSFEKIEKGGPAGSGCRKGCLWAMNPEKISKMDDEVAKWSKKDPNAIRRAMRYPEDLEKLERGDLKIGFSRRITVKDECEEEEVEEEEERSEAEDESCEEDEEEEDEEEDEEDEKEEEDERQIESCNGEEIDSEDEGEVPPSLRPFDHTNRLDFPQNRLPSKTISRLPLDLSDEMYEEMDLLHQVVSSEEDIFCMNQTKRPRLQCVL